MNKKTPFTVVNTHILPEVRECKLEQDKYADMADFSLVIHGEFPKGSTLLKKLFAFREKEGYPFIAENGKMPLRKKDIFGRSRKKRLF